jgi:hypothetical protein
MPPGFEAELRRNLRSAEADRVQRENQQGLGKGIISAQVAGHRVVAVGNRVLFSKKWKTFHDFLCHYLIDQLGRDWFKNEQTKPRVERHPIVRWYDKAIADSDPFAKKVGDVVIAPMTGAQRAFLNLAYNIYLIAHHAEPKESKSLLASFLGKLKSERSDDFIGKLFETYAAAAFLKAGFSIAYEDETDGSTSHVEFVATYPRSGKKLSVEVKSRNRSMNEDGPIDEPKRLRVINKLNRALTKKTDYTRVVMIEINVPDVVTVPKLDGWPRAALAQVRQAERTNAPDGTEKPSAYVLVTNHAFHNNLDAVGAGAQVLATGCRIPDFGPDVGFSRFKDALDSRERHREVFALLDSMRTHYDIPATFDGQNPELAFMKDSDTPRLKIGQWYVVPGPDGKEVPARFYEGTVIESEKRVMGAYETVDGNHFLSSCPLTDAELAAWKRHPDTFFGEIRRVSKSVSNWLEMAEFLYEAYQHSPREKLLEWMKGAGDIDELRKLSQRELAIIYCERMAWAVTKPNKTAA